MAAGDRQDVVAGVVEQHPRVPAPGPPPARNRSRSCLGVRHPAGRGERDAPGVVDHRGGHAVQVRVLRQRQVEDVRASGRTGSARARAWPGSPRASRPSAATRTRSSSSGIESASCCAVSSATWDWPGEHRAVDAEVVVVRAVERVEVHRAGRGPGTSRRPRWRRVLAATASGSPRTARQVRRHVVQVPGVGDQVRAAGRQRQALLRRRRTSPSGGCTCAAGQGAAGPSGRPVPAPAPRLASAVREPWAGSPVRRSHSCQGVRFISASA